MPSTIRLKSGAGWLGPVADGNLRLKWGGPWISPSYVRHKVGDVGGGYWRDTGYRGYPNPPSGPWVHYWPTHNNVQFAWNYAGAGGAPVAHYQVVLTDSSGNWLATEDSTDNLSPYWGVGPDGYYQCFVRSVAANGLTSPFQGPVRIRMGHDATPNYAWVHHTQPWASGWDVGGDGWSHGYMDNVCGPGAPGDVQVESIHWQLYSSYGFTSQLSPGTNRVIYVVLNGGQDPYGWGQTGWWNGIDAWDYFSFTGNGGANGFVCRGVGWSVAPTGGQNKRVCGYITVHGTQHWDSYDIVSWNPDVANGYW